MRKSYREKRIERLKKFPPKLRENRILFETENDFEGNARILYEYLIESGYNKKYEIIWLMREPEKYAKYAKDNVKFIQSFEKDSEDRLPVCYKYMLSSKYIFYTESVNWIDMSRKNQIFINLWEGCGYKINKKRHKIFFDYCLTRSEAFTQSNKAYFGCPSRKMIPLGYPCFDYILKGSADAQKYAEKMLKNSNSRKLVLWMPSTRKKKGEQAEHIFNLPVIKDAAMLRKLDELCRECEVTILVKNNYLRMTEGDRLTNIIGFKDKDLEKNNLKLYELFRYADAFIGDYTREIIDWLILDRPTGYLLDTFGSPGKERRWSVENPLTYMPGKHICQFEDIESFILDVKNEKDDFKAQRSEVLKKIHNKCDNYCQRILDYFDIRLS